MKKIRGYKKIVLITGIVIAILLASGAIFVVWNLKRTVPETSGYIESNGINTDVKVYFDSKGIPHIFAGSETDAYFVLGYLQASERLFQMELLRRVGGGRLSEIFGKELINTDKFLRATGISQSAHKEAAAWDTLQTPWVNDSKQFLKGVNAFIDNGPLPEEFVLLNIKPEPFTPSDIYLITGYMAFSFAEALRTDPIVTSIADRYGAAYLKLFGIMSVNDTVIANQKSAGASQQLAAYISALGQPLPLTPFIGSNGWVLSSDHSKSGKPLFANDTHIGYQQPCIWYDAQLNYPGTSVYGHFLAGLPFPLTGHTDDHAWGLTMFENDDMNLYYETLVSGSTYKHGSEIVPLLTIKDTIVVKGEPPVLFNMRSTIHGPLVNELISNINDSAHTPTTLWWSYVHFPATGPQVTYELLNAHTIETARAAVEKINAPGLNVLYANTSGDIACWSAAKLPKYRDGLNTKLILNGSSGADEPLEYFPFTNNPQIENPASGIIISANQLPGPDRTTLNVQGYYAPNDRADRIQKLLTTRSVWDIENLKAVQIDIISDVQSANAKIIVQVLKRSKLTKDQIKALSMLANWNGSHHVFETGPSIYYETLAEILEGAMADECGAFGQSVLVNTHLMKSSYYKLLSDSVSPWWDNVNTKNKIETRDDIIFAAFKRATSYLSKELDENPTNWSWGRMHSLTHKHPVGTIKPFDLLFNVGPFPVPGGIETINNSSFLLTTGQQFQVKYGPAMRDLVDLSDPLHALTILPTGESGHVWSAHYNDQAADYIAGNYRTVLMKETEIKSGTNTLLTFKPSGNH
ncbi:MAG TPA: penicillin acylase family protein [Bacteroidia bacterium]|nr:penicillin acylase family protein [Bacteroidia bacterium]